MRLLDPEQFVYHRARVAHYPRATNPVPPAGAEPHATRILYRANVRNGKDRGSRHPFEMHATLRQLRERYISIE